MKTQKSAQCEIQGDYESVTQVEALEGTLPADELFYSLVCWPQHFIQLIEMQGMPCQGGSEPEIALKSLVQSLAQLC